MEIIVTTKEIVYLKDAIKQLKNKQIETLEKIFVKEELGGGKVKITVDQDYVCDVCDIVANLVRGMYFTFAGGSTLLQSSMMQLDSTTEKYINKNKEAFENVAQEENNG
jgi:hypothetical protein